MAQHNEYKIKALMFLYNKFAIPFYRFSKMQLTIATKWCNMIISKASSIKGEI